MNKRGVLLSIIIVFGLVFLSQTVLASIDYSNYSITKNYVSGENIKGFINIKINNESTETTFTSNFNGSIRLKDLLDKNSYVLGNDYNCTLRNCLPGYVKKEAITTVSVSSKKAIGFVISAGSQEGVSINTDLDNPLSLTFQNSVPASCTGNVQIYFDDQNMSLTNNRYTQNPCGNKNYGCFSKSLTNDNYLTLDLGSNALCEKITLPAGAAFRIGANITNSTNGNAAKLEMELRSVTGEFYSNCTLPTLTSLTSEVDCTVEHNSPTPKSYLACVRTSDLLNNNEPNYTIRSEISSNLCGTDNAESPTYGRNYEIYGYGLAFDSLNLMINDSLFENTYGDRLSNRINDYLFENYPQKDNGVICNPYCIIPINIIAQNQQINIVNPYIKYKIGNSLATSSAIYDLDVQPSKINSNYLYIDLSKTGFSVSNSTNFTLYFGGSQLINSSINVSGTFNFTIRPNVVLVGFNTEFTAVTDENITSSTWTFTNNSVVQSSNNRASYKFTSSGNYTITVELTNGKGIKSKNSFLVSVGQARESANLSLNYAISRISNLTSQVNAYPPWVRSELYTKLNINELNASITSISKDYRDATTDSEYILVLEKLNDLEIPNSLSITKSGNGLALASGFNNINTGYIEEISGDTSSGDLKSAITKWYSKNYDGKIDFEVISIGNAPLLTKVKINLNKKDESAEDAYLIIDYPIESIKFADSYSQESISEGAATSIPITESKSIEFLLPEEVNVRDLGAYISPKIESLSVEEDILPAEKPGFPWLFFIIGLIVLAVVTFIAYTAIRNWYRRNYERHLFKSPNDLYNIINFIWNKRGEGFGDSEIKRNLSKAGWSGEQITYAFKRIKGKRAY